MYLNHYNLKHKPFQISTNPGFLWLGEKHMEALATLRYGVMDNKGFLLLTGDVGTGKTTLINALLSTLGDNVLAISVRDPALQPMEFYEFVAHSFNMTGEISNKISFLINFEKFLNDAYNNDKKVLLIIDEAQRIDQILLEEVRSLSNIERDDSKLLNIFFVGQIEFNDILLRQENRALRQRITVNYNIETLSEQETEEYIKHRLHIARISETPELPSTPSVKSEDLFVQERFPTLGSTDEDGLFTHGAIREIYFFSKGYPRLINIICDRCLLTGYVEEAPVITKSHVIECTKELEIPDFGTFSQTPAADSEKNSEEPRHIHRKRDDIQISEAPHFSLNENHSKAPVPQKTESQIQHERIQPVRNIYRRTLLVSVFTVLTAVILFNFLPDDNGIKKQISQKIEQSELLTAIKPFFTPASLPADDGSSHTTSSSQEKQPGSLQGDTVFMKMAQGVQNLLPEEQSPIVLAKLVVSFPPESPMPPHDSLYNLDNFITIIEQQKDLQVLIRGVIDNSKGELDRDLSLQKAGAIKLYAISKGIDPGRIRIDILDDISQNSGSDSPNTSGPKNIIEIILLHAEESVATTLQ